MTDDRDDLYDLMVRIKALAAGIAAVQAQRVSYERFEGIRYEEAEGVLLRMLARQIEEICFGMDDKTGRIKL